VNDSIESSRPQGRAPWLLLIHRLPPRPDYLRVKVRRRLARLGAIPLKSTVYVLPWSEEALEDFQWLRREIEADGGEAVLCSASLIEGLSDAALEARFQNPMALERAESAAPELPNVAGGRIWVTRQDVHVDRIASAWLIGRFIDLKARFKFVKSRGYRPKKGELRFDMYEGEFTHEGPDCTFEVLLRRFGVDDPALVALGQMVHDIDCKDGKFRRPETPGLRRLIHGVVTAEADDSARLERGAALLDTLYSGLPKRRT
jgi:hypothetical protein